MFILFSIRFSVVVVADICFVPSFIHISKFMGSSTHKHDSFSLSLSISLSRFYFFLFSSHLLNSTRLDARSHIHTHTLIRKHSSYTIFSVCCCCCCSVACCFVMPKLTLNVKCRNLLIFLLVCAHSLSRSLALSLSIYCSI